MRVAVAVIVSVIAAPVIAFLAVLAGLTLIQEIAATFIDLGNASWTSWMNPAVWLGVQSPGGSGGVIDMLVGGPGAVGGTAGRFVVFAICGGIAFGLVKALGALWQWARSASVSGARP